MAFHALVTFVCIALAVVFFTVPLFLKYHTYRPQSSRVVPGDVVKVQGRLSSVWCQGVILDSESSFKAFTYDSEPDVDEDEVERTVATHHITLPNKAQEFWGFHLLRGSHVQMSTCARLLVADVNVVKGHDGLKECLLEHRVKHYEDEFSGEDSLSQSESDEDTSSISSSQGVVTNETDSPYECTNSLFHVVFSTNYTCKHPFHNVVRTHSLSQDIEESDYYYYIFASNTYLDILQNEINVRFTIDRTHYNYSSSSGNCTMGNHCHLPIDMGSEPVIVVQMASLNGTLEELKLVMSCKPREWLFLGFYALFMLVIFLCAFHQDVILSIFKSRGYLSRTIVIEKGAPRCSGCELLVTKICFPLILIPYRPYFEKLQEDLTYV